MGIAGGTAGGSVKLSVKVVFNNIVAMIPSIPDQSRAHTRIYIKLPYFSSFLFLRRL